MQRAARHRARALRDTTPVMAPRAPILDLDLDDRGLLGLSLDLPIVTDIVTLLQGGKTVTTTSTHTAPTTTSTTPVNTPTTTTTSTTTTPDSGPTSTGGGSGSGGDGSGSGSGNGNGDGSGNDSGSSGNNGSSASVDSSSSTAAGGGGSNPDDNSKTTKTGTGGVFAVGADPTTANAKPTGPTSFLVVGSKTVAVIGSITYSDGIPTSTPGGPANVTGDGDTSGGQKKHGGVPTGALAAVGVIVALILLGLLLFGLRRRAKNKRAERRTWWTAGLGRSNSDRRWGGSDDATAGDSSAAKSIRSSFGTTFDHSEFSITFDDNDVPSLPPMVEIRGGPATVPKGDPSMSGNTQLISPISPVSPFAPLAPIVAPVALLVSIENSNVFSDANRRTSTGSNLSQHITYDRDGAKNPELAATPMSVRPFSPSESFAFPAPPPRESQLVSPMIPLTPSPMVPQITESLLPSPPVENPFADAFAAAPASSSPFAAVETIFRAFEQTLQDELSVQSGDQVKVLAVYDDGWAMVERVDVSGKGKGKEGAKVVGLIPIDCMRRADESVTSFLAAKRVSSVDVDATGYTAMAV